MPRCLDSKAQFEVFLSSDAEKPKQKRPVFIFRYISGRRWKDAVIASDLLQKSKKSKLTGQAMLSKVYEQIKFSLKGWRNMVGVDGKNIAFNANKVDDILVPGEAVELLLAIITQEPTPEIDHKKDKK